jgi:hypothetical protein
MMTTATHPQKGQDWTMEKGNREVLRARHTERVNTSFGCSAQLVPDASRRGIYREKAIILDPKKAVQPREL